MTLEYALTADLRGFDTDELDEARSTVGAAKLDLRRRLAWAEVIGAVRRYNARLDEINAVYCDRQLDEGKRRKERLDRERRERNGNG